MWLRQKPGHVARTGLFLALAVAAGHAQDLTTLYTQLLQPQVAQTAAIAHTRFTYDGIQLDLQDGTLGLTQPVAGHCTAAVFIGHGNFALAAPLDPTDARQWELLSGANELALAFNAAVFRFPDASRWIASVGGQLQLTSGAGPPALGKLLAERAQATEAAALSEPVRLLDVLRQSAPPPAQSPLFYAEVRASNGNWIQLDFDPMRAAPLRVHRRLTQWEPLGNWNGRAFPGTPSAPADSRRSAAAPDTIATAYDDTWAETGTPADPPPAWPWRITDYDITITIAANSIVQVDDTLTAQPARPGLTGILLSLDGRFRVSDVEDAGGSKLPWLQARDPSLEIGGAHARRLTIPGGPYEGDWLYIALPASSPGAGPVRLKIAYAFSTKVAYATPMLGSPFTPGAWDIDEFMLKAWYPLDPFGPAFQPANFHIRLHAPPSAGPYIPNGTLAVSGAAASGGDWSSTVAAASAALLPAPKHTALQKIAIAPDRTVTLRSDTTPWTYAPHERSELRDALAFFSRAFGAYPFPELVEIEGGASPILDPVTSLKIYQPALVPSNVRSRLIVPGIPAREGRDAPSWPGLVMLNPGWPIEAFCTSCPRSLTPPAARQLGYVVVPHVVAHQWWGLWVGSPGGRDAWLPEALANGSAWLFVRDEFGAAVSDAVLADWQDELTTPDAFHRVPDALGPLALGNRLCSSLDPLGFDEVALDKGGYVIEMLAAMMQGAGSGSSAASDAGFFSLAHDLVSTYGGRNLTTADFLAAVTKHMTPAMDLDGDHSLDWFFREYVFGTAIARLRVSTRTLPGPGGARVLVHAENPDGWEGLLPVYVMQDAIHGRRALIPVKGPQVDASLTVTFPPQSVQIDPHHEMLVLIQPPPPDARGR